MKKEQNLNNAETQALNISAVRRNFIERYKKITKSEWFKQAYNDNSTGDSINYT